MSTPAREEILATITAVLHELFEVDTAKVSLTTNLFTDLDLDSLDAIDLAASLSKKVQLKLSTEEMKKIRTVGDIVEIAIQKLGPAA